MTFGAARAQEESLRNTNSILGTLSKYHPRMLSHCFVQHIPDFCWWNVVIRLFSLNLRLSIQTAFISYLRFQEL